MSVYGPCYMSFLYLLLCVCVCMCVCVFCFSGHCIAIVGALHLFIAVLMLMAAGHGDAGHRKCILGIYLITFVPSAISAQYLYPATGTPPASPMDMPLPIMYALGGFSLLGLIFGGKPKNTKKKAK